MPAPISVGYWEYLNPASNLLGRVFDRDPILRYMLCNLSDEEYQALLRPYWYGLCRAALLNGGAILEAGLWKSVAVVLPPGRSVDSLWSIIPSAVGLLRVLWKIGIAGCIRMLGDYSRPANALKKSVLRGQGHYYIFALGTEYQYQGQGLARALIENVRETAWCAEVPVWLEATTEYSRDLYQSLGFELVEEITIGKGQAASDGTMQVGGLGVRLWAMVWWPKPLQGFIDA
ncbi:hypothetical protein BDV18DRAFT_161514 [Aspergillus unguis]